MREADLSDDAVVGRHDPVLFETLLVPHCSLSGTGFTVVMVAVIVASAAIGIGFSMVGAWPVIGFFGLDVLLIYGAFRMGYRAARRREHIRVSASRIEIHTIDPAGQGRSTVLQTYWLQVELQPGPAGRLKLVLRSHGREVELGAFLGPDEKAALAASLSRVLGESRSGPV